MRKNFVLSILIFILLSLITLVSPIGLRLVIPIIQNRLPGLSFQSVHGSIISNIQINQLQYQSEKIVFSAKDITLNLNLINLIHRKIYLQQLSIRNAHLQIRDTTSQKNNSKQTINTLLKNLQRLRIDRLKISPLTIEQKNRKTIVLSHIYSQINFINKIFSSTSITMTQPLSATNQFNISGSIHHYHFTNHLIIGHQQLSIKGNGNNKHLTSVFTINNQYNHGQLSLTWQPLIKWRWSIQVKQLQVATINKALPNIKTLTGSGEGSLQRFSNKLQLTLEYNGKNIHSKASAFRDNNQTKIIIQNKMNLSYLNIQAKYNKEWSAAWQTNITDLNQWYPVTEGSMQSNGEVSLHSNYIETHGQITGRNSSWKNIKTKYIQLSWLFQPKIQRLTIESDAFRIKQYLIDNIYLHMRGNSSKQQWQAKLNRKQKSLTIYAQSHKLPTKWLIHIKQWSLKANKEKIWSLAQPTTIEIQKQHLIKTQQICWHHQSQQICGTGYWSPASWSTQWSSNVLDTQVLSNTLNQNITLKGLGQLKLNANGNGRHIETMALTGSTGPIQLHYSNNIMKLKLTQLKINLNQKKGLNAIFEAKPENHPKLIAELAIPTYFGHGLPSGNEPIKGKVIWSSNIQLLLSIIPKLARPKGDINANFRIKGTLKQPNIFGTIKLNNGFFDIPQFGITLNNISTQINAQSNIINVNGSAYSDNRPIQFNGRFKLNPLQGNINIKAKKILIWNTPYYQFIVTPNLNTEINQKTIHLSGKVTINQGIVRPTNFNQVLSLPNETRFIGSGPWQNRSELWPWSMNISLKAGKQLLINTMGLKGKLQGHLQLKKIASQPILGTGKLTFAKDSLFSTHNQTIKISSGHLIFAQSPLGNPLIDIQAIRTFNNFSSSNFHNMNGNSLTVGAHITGHLNKPSINFFSTPTELSQGDILAYLVLGQTISTEAVANLPILLDALNALRFGNDNNISLANMQNELQKNFGINELTIETQNTIDSLDNILDYQTALVIGKSLTNKIHIRYNMGLSGTNPINSMQLRYHFNPRWFIQSTIETNNNNAKGVDIFYNINHN